MFECLLCLRRACSDTKDTLKAYHSATRRLLKKKIHFGVLSDFCASSVLTLLSGRDQSTSASLLCETE